MSLEKPPDGMTFRHDPDHIDELKDDLAKHEIETLTKQHPDLFIGNGSVLACLNVAFEIFRTQKRMEYAKVAHESVCHDTDSCKECEELEEERALIDHATARFNDSYRFVLRDFVTRKIHDRMDVNYSVQKPFISTPNIEEIKALHAAKMAELAAAPLIHFDLAGNLLPKAMPVVKFDEEIGSKFLAVFNPLTMKKTDAADKPKP